MSEPIPVLIRIVCPKCGNSFSITKSIEDEAKWLEENGFLFVPTNPNWIGWYGPEAYCQRCRKDYLELLGSREE